VIFIEISSKNRIRRTHDNNDHRLNWAAKIYARDSSHASVMRLFQDPTDDT
jgi:hypothetical protein